MDCLPSLICAIFACVCVCVCVCVCFTFLRQAFSCKGYNLKSEWARKVTKKNWHDNGKVSKWLLLLHSLCKLSRQIHWRVCFRKKIIFFTLSLCSTFIHLFSFSKNYMDNVCLLPTPSPPPRKKHQLEVTVYVHIEGALYCSCLTALIQLEK